MPKLYSSNSLISNIITVLSTHTSTVLLSDEMYGVATATNTLYVSSSTPHHPVLSSAAFENVETTVDDDDNSQDGAAAATAEMAYTDKLI